MSSVSKNEIMQHLGAVDPPFTRQQLQAQFNWFRVHLQIVEKEPEITLLADQLFQFRIFVKTFGLMLQAEDCMISFSPLQLSQYCQNMLSTLFRTKTSYTMQNLEEYFNHSFGAQYFVKRESQLVVSGKPLELFPEERQNVYFVYFVFLVLMRLGNLRESARELLGRSASVVVRSPAQAADEPRRSVSQYPAREPGRAQHPDAVDQGLNETRTNVLAKTSATENLGDSANLGESLIEFPPGSAQIPEGDALAFTAGQGAQAEGQVQEFDDAFSPQRKPGSKNAQLDADVADALRQSERVLSRGRSSLDAKPAAIPEIGDEQIRLDDFAALQEKQTAVEQQKDAYQTQPTEDAGNLLLMRDAQSVFLKNENECLKKQLQEYATLREDYELCKEKLAHVEELVVYQEEQLELAEKEGAVLKAKAEQSAAAMSQLGVVDDMSAQNEQLAMQAKSMQGQLQTLQKVLNEKSAQNFALTEEAQTLRHQNEQLTRTIEQNRKTTQELADVCTSKNRDLIKQLQVRDQTVIELQARLQLKNANQMEFEQKQQDAIQKYQEMLSAQERRHLELSKDLSVAQIKLQEMELIKKRIADFERSTASFKEQQERKQASIQAENQRLAQQNKTLIEGNRMAIGKAEALLTELKGTQAKYNQLLQYYKALYGKHSLLTGLISRGEDLIEHGVQINPADQAAYNQMALKLVSLQAEYAKLEDVYAKLQGEFVASEHRASVLQEQLAAARSGEGAKQQKLPLPASAIFPAASGLLQLGSVAGPERSFDLLLGTQVKASQAAQEAKEDEKAANSQPKQPPQDQPKACVPLTQQQHETKPAEEKPLPQIQALQYEDNSLLNSVAATQGNFSPLLVCAGPKGGAAADGKEAKESKLATTGELNFGDFQLESSGAVRRSSDV